MKIKQFLAIGVMTFLAFLSMQIAGYAAEVISVQGNVQVQSPSNGEWKRAEKGMQLAIGDLIRTARNSVAEVALDTEKKNTIRIEQSALITLNSATANTMDRLDLAKGKVYANLENIKAGLTFEVNTPSAVAGVRGSAVSVYVERDSDEIVALKDTIFIKTFNVDKQLVSEVDLPEGFKTMVERFGEPSVFYQISSREFEHFDNKMDDLSANLEGRMSARAQAAEERREAHKAKEERAAQEKTLDQVADQVSEQHAITQEAADTQATEDMNNLKSLEETLKETPADDHEMSDDELYYLYLEDQQGFCATHPGSMYC